jgi:glycosyltransferase involved in cell wall biosynthesis
MSTLISVVIPTRNRPPLVIRAVQTALAQTMRDVEVIVVIDGPDASTEQALSRVDDVRLRVIALKQNVGGARARNIGVQEATGEWVALLDDDDEWLPEKLDKQIRVLSASNSLHPICACRLFARTDGGDKIWPRRRPYPNEPMSEYLLCRSSLGFGEGIIQTSAIVVRRELLLKVPFTPQLPRHQDWDWLLRVSKLEGVSFEWVWEPLAIYNLEGGRWSVNRTSTWRESLNWANANHQHFTPRAYSYFAAIQIAPRLNLVRDYSSLPLLIRSLLRHGSFNLRALLFGVLFAGVPTTLLKKVSQANLIGKDSVHRRVECLTPPAKTIS